MNIRCETSADYLAISQVNNLAFGTGNEAPLITEIRNSDYCIPCCESHILVNLLGFSYKIR